MNIFTVRVRPVDGLVGIERRGNSIKLIPI
jgi:hypothetical protein